MRPAGLLLLAILALGRPAAAQEADSLALAPPDPSAADSSATEAPLPMGPAAPPPGAVVSAVPARTRSATAAEALASAPGAFLYDLGTPGAAHGLALGGLAPRRLGLALDGLPATDLFSGRPAWELLPAEVLGPLRLAPGRFGEPLGVEAGTRAFAAAVPVTELRYLTGPDALQFVSATHAQTRRPGFAGRDGRLTALFHVAGRRAEGPIEASGVNGWRLLARAGLVRPRFALELSERHTRERAGAGGGVLPGADPFAGRPPVVSPRAERETIRNDLAATLRLRLVGGAPLTAAASWTAETFRYANPDLGPDTLAAVGRRYGLRLEQPLEAGAHRLVLRADAWADRLTGGNALGGGTEGALHLAIVDSLALGGLDIGLAAGWHRAPGAAFPTASAGAERQLGATRLRLGARYAGAAPARMEREGFGGVLRIANPAGTERTLAAEAALEAALGPFDLAAEARWLRQEDPRVLLAGADSVAAFETVAGAFGRIVGALGLGWRERASRGFHLRVRGNVHRFLNPDASPVHRREAGALPEAWGTARLGWRARALFEGALDLDLAIEGRGWTAFRGRMLHAPTGLFALPPPGAAGVPAGGTVGVLAEARLGRRALVFVSYANALGGRTYAVPVHPLPGPGLRLGLFWVLVN